MVEFNLTIWANLVLSGFRGLVLESYNDYGVITRQMIYMDLPDETTYSIEMNDYQVLEMARGV